MPGNKISTSQPPVPPSAPAARQDTDETAQAGQAFGRKTASASRKRGRLRSAFHKISLSRKNRAIVKRKIKSMLSAIWHLFKGRRVSSRQVRTRMQQGKQARDVIPEYQGLVKSPPTLDNYKQGEILGKGAFGKVYTATNHSKTEPDKKLDKAYVVKAQEIHTPHHLGIAEKETSLQQQIPFAPVIHHTDLRHTKNDEGQRIQEHRTLMENRGVSLSRLLKSWQPAQRYEDEDDEAWEKRVATARQQAEATTGLKVNARDYLALPTNLARSVGKQIATQLTELHSDHIAHRDIKTDNVLIDGKGKVTIVDYGLSKQTPPQDGEDPENAVISSSISGSPAYFAPEMIAGEPYSTKIDVWCLGLVMAELLTGERAPHVQSPSPGEFAFNPKGLQRFHKFISRHPHLPPDAKDLLLKMLEPDPLRRPTSSAVLAHPFFQQQAGNESYADLQTQHIEAFNQLAAQEQLQADILR